MKWEGEFDVMSKQRDCSMGEVVLCSTFEQCLALNDTCLLLSLARPHKDPSDFRTLVKLTVLISNHSLPVVCPSMEESLCWSVDILWVYIGPVFGRSERAAHAEGGWELGCISGSSRELVYRIQVDGPLFNVER